MRTGDHSNSPSWQFVGGAEEGEKGWGGRVPPVNQKPPLPGRCTHKRGRGEDWCGMIQRGSRKAGKTSKSQSLRVYIKSWVEMPDGWPGMSSQAGVKKGDRLLRELRTMEMVRWAKKKPAGIRRTQPSVQSWGQFACF